MEKVTKSKFSLSYLFGGDPENRLKDWFKSWGLGWRLLVTILVILFIGVTIYRAFFQKTQKQTQSQTQRMNVLPLSFSTINYTPQQAQQQEQKQEVKKRPWWLPVIFVEGYGFGEANNDNTTRTGFGGRLGGRLEF